MAKQDYIEKEKKWMLWEKSKLKQSCDLKLSTTLNKILCLGKITKHSICILLINVKTYHSELVSGSCW